ncbi:MULTISPECIES: daptide-type RiPP biosynthesis methyltransferase [unclassified Microbacterium]|uniref:daptide-type RiPP biosynthesis methyltransferase n=1 Tax=unclassified Microbacterium TaxID=2609290 RepID=UPI0017852978|nr:MULTISPECIES: daptide-type RiPP biosynthesis methyltransferase [unclassified Microbacterium]MBD8206453.1 class I SAM-dependent methyltransferase [Microbacterium sp. CFBP 8801]MBD8478375.1 class I SAM-dependent methyltransferase [Microbacterium sp. CFBP 8794]MBD8508351.1 class I SAM-dependent methyltransferase [Microbacterium sp. CFBP 8790]
MTDLLTASVRQRLADAGRRAAPHDVYAGVGARFYDDLVGPDRSEIHEVLTVARRGGPAVLDLAAGTGRVTLPLLRAGKHVTALDLSTDMLDRLRVALPYGARCDLVAADMRDFDLDRRFDLVVLAATSITLLDAPGRARLFAAVRRHLGERGSFLLSVAGSVTVEALDVTVDRVIDIDREGVIEVFLQSQEVDAGGRARLVNWVPLAEVAPDEEVPVLTTRLHLLDVATVSAELVEAGFSAPTVLPVRGGGLAPGEGMVLLETCDPGWAGRAG